ncbi:hypothetical protein [Neptuniibacter sp. QD37_11]|uniref:hypothetical protein n=1 Tax=Neptuniibacter sp. QD37_11 TaxID=3398209 RepID=UPI0039F4A776
MSATSVLGVELQEDGLDYVRIDKARVGTPDYEGHAYFWDPEFKHTLRDVSEEQRKAVHDRWLAEGLALDGRTQRHADILGEMFGPQHCHQVQNPDTV